MQELKILCTGEYDQTGFDSFAKYGMLTVTSDANNPGLPGLLTDEELKEKLSDTDIYICGYEKITAETLKAAPQLKLILSVRDGPEENIDVKACEALGIPVLSSAGRCATSVTELTVALMLLCARPVIKLTNEIHKDGWTKDNATEIRAMYADYSTELFNKNVGIIGLGRNGFKVAKLCQAFGMNVLGYDPYFDQDVAAREQIKMVELDELVSFSDYVVVLARLTPETEGMISREKIALMKPSACLINTGRGKLIDNDALFDALQEDKIRMAALDAHPTEPLGIDNRAMQISPDKLILTPHMAGKTAERNWHQYQLLLEHFKDYIEGTEQPMPYTPHVMDGSEYAARGGYLFGLMAK